jgi:hypothetical protein
MGIRLAMVAAVLVGATTTAAAGPGGRVGVVADVGVPDGAGASVLFHPVSALQLSAGVTHNAVTLGYRGGIAFVPFHRSTFSPTLAVSYGHFPEGDANGLMAFVLDDPTYSSPLLERVGYDFADLHLGFEVGSRRVKFSLAAGMSRVTGTVHGIEDTDGDAETSIVLTSEPTVEAWIPSARLGFAFYL